MDIKNIVSEVINNYINDIINESKDLLTERVSSVIYHWCSPQTAIKILNNNRFSLMNNLFKRAESDLVGTSHNRMWYMSLTRNPNIGQGGYNNSGSYYIRLTLDGDKINSNFHTKAIDYWGKYMGKNSRYQMAREDGTKIEKPMSETEAEDRLYSRKPFIEDAISYIKAIDILFEKDKYEKDGVIIHPSIVTQIYYILVKTNKICTVYTSIEDFNANRNPLSYEEFSEWFYHKKGITDLSYHDIDVRYSKIHAKFLASVVYLVNFPYGNFKDCMRTLKEYGLERYSKQVANFIQNNHSWDYDFWFGDKRAYDLKAIQRTVLGHFQNIELANDAQAMDREDLAKAYSILSDFCKKHKLKTKFDFIKYFTKVLNKEEIKSDAYKQQYNIICVSIPIDSEMYLCIEPNQTKYADIFGKNTLKWMFDDLTYYVDSHKSKNDEKFKNYLKHLLLKGNPTIQDIITLYDNLKSLGNDRLDLDYKPILSNKQTDYWAIKYAFDGKDDDYSQNIRTTDDSYVKITDKNQYNQLKQLIDNYGKSSNTND